MSKRQVIFDARVKFKVNIPDKVPEDRKVEYAKKFVQKRLDELCEGFFESITVTPFVKD